MNNKPLLAVPIKYGLVASIFNIILLVIFFQMGRHPLLIPIYFDSRIIIFLIFIYFAIRDYRENHNGGYLHLWEGMILGIITYVIVGIVGAFFIKIYGSINPEFLSGYISDTVQGMEANKEELVNGSQKVKMTQEEYDGYVEIVKNTTISNLAVDYFIKTLIIGFLIPMIYSVFFRKVNR